MDLSTNGLRFIARREALVLVAYQDGPHKSIGFGSNDPSLKEGDRITAAEAFARLKQDVAPRARRVSNLLRKPVEQHQFDALVSLHYQSGNRYLPRIINLINEGNLHDAAMTFPSCDQNMAGERLPGLHKRRLLEQKLFMTGDYGIDLDEIPYWKGDPRKTKPETYHVQPGDFA